MSEEKDYRDVWSSMNEDYPSESTTYITDQCDDENKCNKNKDLLNFGTNSDHYKATKFQPLEVSMEWLTNEELNGAYLFNIIKYIGRHKYKGTPLKDLKKAKDYLQLLIDNYEKKEENKTT